MSLFTAFDAVALSNASRTAIYWGDAELSYAWLGSCAAWVSGKVRELGLQKDDRVAVWLKNCPEFPAALFGVWRAGGVVTLINNFLKPDEVAYIVKDAGAKIIITDASLAEARTKVSAMMPELKFIDVASFEEGDVNAASVTADASELAALLYTSGTTGHPKGAMLTHGNFLSNVRSCQQCLEITADDKLVVLLPQFHSFMFTVGTLLPLLSGAAILLIKTLHPMKHVLEEIIRRKGTLLPAVPQLHRALAGLPAGLELPLRLCVSGGAPMPLEVLKQFKERWPGIPLIEGYGPTESSPVATVNPIHGPQKAGSVGVPIMDVALSIRDDNGNELPIGSTGEICIQGPNVMQGYWNQPEETALTLRDGWLYTGDIGHRDADNFYYITDRKKDMLLVNGINVYPREVEEVIYQFPGVKEAAVVGMPDQRKGEQPVAFVVAADGVTLDEKSIIHHIREHLADYKVPRHVHFLTALPRNATGKVLKTELRKQRPLN